MALTHSLRLRLLLGDEIAMGPGKARLLEAIQASGSISSAAVALGMSYRRAWLLVETMNACFASPLVESVKGGVGGGGAHLTEAGQAVLGAFKAVEDDVDALVKSRIETFKPYLAKPRTRKRESS